MAKHLTAFRANAAGRLDSWCRPCRRSYWRERHPQAEPVRPSLSEAQKGYIAGLIDGEGSIHLHVARSYSLALSIANTDEGLMTWLLEHVGGSVQYREPRPNPNHKPVHRWYLSTVGGVWLLQHLAPYLVIKRRRAEIAVEFFRQRRVHRESADRIEAVTRALPPPLADLYAELRALNRRGVA